jgi:demethylmenaquinone methyltransferase/2-methoxy-6-polyprenyl-1,4-benzoquinol methylase
MAHGVQKIYAEIAPAYERANHILTLGWDRRWRREAATRAAALLAERAAEGPVTPEARGADGPRRPRCLDVCSGTGEMAEGLRAAWGAGAIEIVLADFSVPMLAVARGKPSLAGPGVTFAASDAARLPFPDATFDAITIGFATRNLDSNRERLLRHLREFRRVLRPGGFFLNLETSQPRAGLWRELFHLYVALAVRPIGRWVSGSSGYAYLAHTIPRFHAGAELTALLREAGFARVEETSRLGGIAAVHVAWA